MAYYEYHCQSCDTTFTKRRKMAEANLPATCNCGSDETYKLLSRVSFKMASASAASTRRESIPMPMAGGGCCGGSCGCG